MEVTSRVKDALPARPLQIISIGNGDECELNQENLDEIFSKIPRGAEVSILSVVGGFRSGKSFILNLILRYLRSKRVDELGEEWMTEEGDKISEGNCNAANSSRGAESSPGSDTPTSSVDAPLSFAWRGGDSRMTTGIWMWSEPFMRKSKKFQGAILVMDTQGMFDNQTSMNMTAQIFGLSTLVSAHQIYNVEKMLGEDKLQHLALFSEYGRMAFKPSAEAASSPVVEVVEVASTKMFQRLQFLVRDYQNLDEDDYDEDTWYQASAQEKSDRMARMERHMADYMKGVINPQNKTATDLKLTRDQISRCFQTVDCFVLPHPGEKVIRKSYDGSIKDISPVFRILVNRFIRKVIEEELEAKRINDRDMTGPELKIFFESYFAIIRDSKNKIPEAMTMLEASALANNRSAFTVAFDSYKFDMDNCLGISPRSSSNVFSSAREPNFVKEDLLRECHDRAHAAAITKFDDRAKMGPVSSIQKYRDDLEGKVEEERAKYFENNSLRNPFKDTEKYAIPVTVGVGSWFFSKVINIFCDHSVCTKASSLLNRLFLLFFVAFLFFFWNKIQSIVVYMQELLPAFNAAAAAAKVKKEN